MATGRIGTTPALQVRWSKAPNTGTTSLSGLDDNSVSLVYSVGYEAVYRNGVLLSRGNDYTATNGTTVTLIDATLSGDIIEIFANQTVPLTDTFSQTVADGRFIKNTLTTTTGDIIYASAANTPARLAIGSTSQVLTVSGGIPAWATPSGGLTLISRTSYSNVASQTFDGVFTSTYKVYLIIVEKHEAVTVNDSFEFIFRYGTTDATGHNGNCIYATTGGTGTAAGTTNAASLKVNIGSGSSVYPLNAVMYVHNVGTGSSIRPAVYGEGWEQYNTRMFQFAGSSDNNQNHTGFKVKSSASNITGTIAVYGYGV